MYIGAEETQQVYVNKKEGNTQEKATTVIESR